MNLGEGVSLESVVFREAVRLPGSSSTAHYIPSEDYPLTYYPEADLIVARCREGVVAMPGHKRQIAYHVSCARDMVLTDSALAPVTAVREQAGVLAMPEARMRQLPGGGFERVTSEEEAPPDEPAPAPKPRAKGRPRKAPAPSLPPHVEPAPAAVSEIANRPRARVKAERGD